MPIALTIAGSDPTAGAGTLADVQTFAAHGVYGVAALTAITVQDTAALERVVPLPPDLVAAQIDAVATDLGVDATKVGMLATAAVVEAVADALERHRLRNVVVDTVLTASVGAVLLDEAGRQALCRRLLPLATVVTPNTDEAAQLTGLPVHTVDQAREAAARLVAMGARAAIVTGGHLDGPPVDVLVDGRRVVELHGERIERYPTHGTGCAFSAALAARLAHGDHLEQAARAAKRYVRTAIAGAVRLGAGRALVRHFPAS